MSSFEKLDNLIMNMNDLDLTDALKEFKQLLKTFDENSSGKIGFRPFLISCRRSKVLSKLEPEVANELAKILADDGSGSILYELFILHLKSLHHQIKKIRSLSKEIVSSHKSETYQLFNQLLAHGSDKKDETFIIVGL
jgi:hypothetical protein